MSEFKFACPICGQHLTADAKDTGSQITCPTCYRKIVVPQAPTTTDPKFVLSASEVNKPRPTTTAAAFEPMQPAPQKTAVPIALVVLFVLACASGATLFFLHGKSKPPAEETRGDGNAPKPETTASPQPEYTGTNRWTFDLASAEIPDAPVSGSVHHRAFEVERATLTGSNLTLRIGTSGNMELGVNVVFYNRLAEELAFKAFEIKSADPTAPRVVLHWMEGERKSETFRHGYAMKVEFGGITNNVIPGKIFLSLPDASQSWVAGTFNAEVRVPKPRNGWSPPPNMPRTQ